MCRGWLAYASAFVVGPDRMPLEAPIARPELMGRPSRISKVRSSWSAWVKLDATFIENGRRATALALGRKVATGPTTSANTNE